MPEIKHTKSTDSENKIKLDSTLVYAVWKGGSACAGGTAGFEVGTSFVGEGAKIKVKGRSEGGKKLGKVKGKMRGNRFSGGFEIPEDCEPGDRVYFEVSISGPGLKGKSNMIPVFPEPVVQNMAWSAKKAGRGDILTLSADVKKVAAGKEARVIIYEYDRDGAHDRITGIPAVVKNSAVEVKWEFQYQKDTDDIPTQEEMEEYGGSYSRPEYFFVIEIDDVEYGTSQESGLLKFEDWIELELVNYTGSEKYVLHLPDGSTREGEFDDKGRMSEKETLPGRYYVEIVEEE